MKKQRDEVRLWLDDSEDAEKVAEQNFRLGNYHVSAFYLHSAVERALKAAIVALNSRAPPKTHNLVRLYKEVARRIPLTESQTDFLAELTPVAQSSRYVDIAMALPKEIYTKGLVKRYLESSKPILRKVKGVISR